ncbi:MAG: hypothetical protein U1E78_04200 [Gammaproteobacteria bacterium]
MSSSNSVLENKFKLKELLDVYLTDVKQISSTSFTPSELKSKQHYVSAITDIQHTGITDMVKYAMSFGRERSGQAKIFEQALPILICWHVRQPNAMDKQYAAVLYQYAVSFKANRRNLKDLMLGFVINSNLSPVKPYFDRELDHVIQRAKSMM